MKHMTVQANASHRAPAPTPPTIQHAPTFLPVPPRDTNLNDKATLGGAGNLGPATDPTPIGPFGGGPSIDGPAGGGSQ